MGALVGAGIARLLVRGRVPERGFGLLVQVSGGGIIGLGLSAEFFATLVQLAGVAVVVNATQMAVWAAAVFVLVRVFRLDRTTATFADIARAQTELGWRQRDDFALCRRRRAQHASECDFGGSLPLPRSEMEGSMKGTSNLIA